MSTADPLALERAGRLKSTLNDASEQSLAGGFIGGRVVRVGNTVRRPASQATPTIQALLDHLRARGFPAPVPLGLDDQGREVLSFIPGRAATHPWPDALLKIEGARQVGKFARRFRDALSGFILPADPAWSHGAQSLGPGEVVTHGDFGPHNLIWEGETLTGLIDFELARPGHPDEDALFALIRVAHLRPDEDAKAVGYHAPPDRLARVLAFAEGYGADPDQLVSQVVSTQNAELQRIETWGGEGMQPWASLLRGGLNKAVRRELAWLEVHLDRVMSGNRTLPSGC